jgi:hypothetical protein
VAQEIAEFEEQRKEEREKEQQEIQALREKRVINLMLGKERNQVKWTNSSYKTFS